MCAYYPGVQDVSGQILGQGIQNAAQTISGGLSDYYKKQEDKKLEESGIAAMQKFATENPELAATVGLKDPNDKAAYKAILKSFGGVPQAMQGMSALHSFARQKKNDNATIELFKIFKKTGDLRQGLEAFANAGGTDLSGVDSVLSKMSGPQVKPQMIFPNKAALDAKFPAEKFDYSMVEDPQTGAITIDKVSPRAPTQSNLPPGFEPDPAKPNAIKPISGSEQDIKRIEAERALQERLGQQRDKATVIINEIDRVLPMVDGMTTGFVGTALNKIPGTEATDVAAIIDAVKANLGFQELQDMRRASPTGGALGSIAVKELDFLQAARGNLSTAQSPKQLKETLGKIRTHYDRWKMTTEGKNPDDAPKVADGPPDGVSAAEWAMMSPKDKELWPK